MTRRSSCEGPFRRYHNVHQRNGRHGGLAVVSSKMSGGPSETAVKRRGKVRLLCYYLRFQLLGTSHAGGDSAHTVSHRRLGYSYHKTRKIFVLLAD